MRNYLLAIATAVFFAAPTYALSQEFDLGPGGVMVGPGYHHRYHEDYERQEGRYGHRGQCRELRAACMHKEELGEVGQGNCRRYREVCGRRYR
jgi:hypothetical protein